MSAQGTTDAVGAPAAPGYSVQDLLAAGPAANAICTPPEAGEEEQGEEPQEPSRGHGRDAA